MQKRKDESINIAIMENEKSITDWSLSDLATELYWWIEFFNTAFFKNQPVPTPVISFEKANVNSLGHYVIGRNAFGVRENINLNKVHLNRLMWDILATLLHELTHSWQATYGKPTNTWFHNKEFQLKLLEFGIVCNNKGAHLGIGDPFMFLLKKHGVKFSFKYPKTPDGIIPIPPKKKTKGQSKLKKWSWLYKYPGCYY